MTVYNDMACDAGYPYGSDENNQIAAMIEADRERDFQEGEEIEEAAARNEQSTGGMR